MSLLDPLSEDDPEAWLLRFLSHFTLGLFAWHALIWTLDPVTAVWAVPLVYFLGWEVAVQRLGAGVWDAVTDAWAMTLGALVGLEILAGPSLVAFLGLFGAGVGSLAWGVWRRL